MALQLYKVQADHHTVIYVVSLVDDFVLILFLA
jgi:hypothetical protein